MAEQKPTKGVVDWTINLGFALGLLLQVVGFAWYAAKLDERVSQHDTRLQRTEQRLVDIDRDALVRLARVEEKLGALLGTMQRIERALDGRRSDASP